MSAAAGCPLLPQVRGGTTPRPLAWAVAAAIALHLALHLAFLWRPSAPRLGAAGAGPMPMTARLIAPATAPMPGATPTPPPASPTTAATAATAAPGVAVPAVAVAGKAATADAVPVAPPSPGGPAPAKGLDSRPAVIGPARDAATPPIAVAGGYRAAASLDRGPIPLHDIVPVYPPEAGMTQGTVVLEILISDAGVVDGVRVVSSRPPGLFERSAVEAFSAARFSPGVALGLPVRSQLTIEVDFTPINRGAEVGSRTY